MSKLENPKRLEEIQPMNTLIKTGLKKNDVFCDIGAGTGIFTIEAAKITEADVYAIDTSDTMLSTIGDKAKTFEIDTIKLINPEAFSYPIEHAVCNYIMLCTVLHEIDDKAALLAELHRIQTANWGDNRVF